MNLDRIIAVRNDKTVYRNGELAIKIFNGCYSCTDVLSEALNQARAAETGLSVPGVAEVTVLDGKWSIISEYVKGRTLARLMEENPADTGVYLEIFTKLQLKMHEKSVPAMSRLYDKLKRRINMADLDGTLRCELLERIDSMPRYDKLCHGDFCPENIVIRRDGEPFILDWPHASAGDPAADAAVTYLLFCLEGASDTAEKYLELLYAGNPAGRQYIQKWIPIAAASLSVRKRSDQRRLLLSWAAESL